MSNRRLDVKLNSSFSIGPRLFLSCPMEISGSKVWFTDLWNYSIVPYLLEAVREGLQVCCKALHLIYCEHMKVNSCTSTQYYTGDISSIDISLKELFNNIFVPTCFLHVQIGMINCLTTFLYCHTSVGLRQESPLGRPHRLGLGVVSLGNGQGRGPLPAEDPP